MDLEWNYVPKCPEGHNLTWKKNYIQRNVDDIQKSVEYVIKPIWMCSTCSQKYCVFCLQPPIYGLKCPSGHTLIEKSLKSNTCDICRKSIIEKGYRDAQCDFDICIQCYQDSQRED